MASLNLCGLLRAAGCPSTDHKDSLKRSARPAISLLRYLCLEFDKGGGRADIMGELNGFASAFCALNTPQLRLARMDVHVGKGDNESGARGGSKDDACHLLALVLARHTDTDYETPKPIKIGDLLPSPACQKEFEAWLGQNGSPDVRRAIKDNSAGSDGGGGMVPDNSSFIKAPSSYNVTAEDDEDDDDVLGAFGKQKEASKKTSAAAATSSGQGKPSGRGAAPPAPAFDPNGKPTRWSDTQMASEIKERIGGAIFIEEEVSSASSWLSEHKAV